MKRAKEIKAGDYINFHMRLSKGGWFVVLKTELTTRNNVRLWESRTRIHTVPAEQWVEVGENMYEPRLLPVQADESKSPAQML